MSGSADAKTERADLVDDAIVIDYFAIGVLVLIALLAVARLFPPPDRAR